MDNVSKFNNPEFYQQLLRYDNLSYRRFNRLNKEQKNKLKDSELLPDEINHILKVYHLIKSTRNSDSISFAINIGIKTYSEFNEWLTTIPLKDRKALSRYASPKRALKELKFRGFVKLDEFKIKPQRSYVMTNSPLNGIHYIHPFEMGSNYKMMEGRKQLPNVWETFGKIGLPGYTRVIYPEMEHPPLLTQSPAQQLKINCSI